MLGHNRVNYFLTSWSDRAELCSLKSNDFGSDE